MKTILLKLAAFLSLIFAGISGFSQNLLSDGSFSTTTVITPLGAPPVPLNTWCSWHNEATVSSLSATVVDGVCRYSFSGTAKESWEVQLAQYGFPLKLNNHYRLSFDAKADAERDFGVYLGEESGSWTDLLDYANYWHHATTNWQTFTLDFIAYNTFPLHKFSLEMGNTTIPMSFDNIMLIDLGPANAGKVSIPGNFQSKIGCSGDWDPACPNTALTYNETNGMYMGTFNIPAGCYQYKVTEGGSWNINYGENGLQNGANIKLYVSEKMEVTFMYDPWTHMVTTSPIPSGFSDQCMPTVVLTGDFQSEAGCAGDWDPSCNKTALTYNPSTLQFEGDITLPAGCYQYRVVENNDWVTNYGSNGSPLGNNYLLSVPTTTSVHFIYNPFNHLVYSAYNHQECLPNKVVLAGSFQSELGCPGDWMPDCSNTELVFNKETGNYEGDLSIPKGCFEFKVVLNGSWNYNYGKWGIPNGENYILSLPVKADVVHFSYNADSHIVSAQYISNVCQPSTVVIVGNFQSELGCAGDWMPDCDNSRLEFDPVTNTWLDTFNIPAGNWEFKVTLDNSWNENYGLYGERNGANIPLALCYPAKVVFHYNHDYHYVFTEIITGGICLTKFYDANVNGYPDAGEVPMAGVAFTLTGENIKQTTITGSDGKAVFSNLPNGMYTVKETVPQGYYTSWADSQIVFVYNYPNQLYFGNVCLGGAGAKGMGYWMSKQGQDAFNKKGNSDYLLMVLRSLYLPDENGNDVDPYTYEALRNWMKGANSKNMSYMMAAQNVALWLNVFAGDVNSNNFVYTGGCHTLYYSGKFMGVTQVTSEVDYLIQQNPLVLAGNPERTNFECFKNALENANNNLSFVQQQPCNTSIVSADPKKPGIEVSIITNLFEPRIWPNPTNTYFNLAPFDNGNNSTIQLRVMDINGRVLYKATGTSDKVYRFGDKFLPGLYFVEMMQGTERKTIKVAKQ